MSEHRLYVIRTSYISYPTLNMPQNMLLNQLNSHVIQLKARSILINDIMYINFFGIIGSFRDVEGVTIAPVGWGIGVANGDGDVVHYKLIYLKRESSRSRSLSNSRVLWLLMICLSIIAVTRMSSTGSSIKSVILCISKPSRNAVNRSLYVSSSLIEKVPSMLFVHHLDPPPEGRFAYWCRRFHVEKFFDIINRSADIFRHI